VIGPLPGHPPPDAVHGPARPLKGCPKAKELHEYLRRRSMRMNRKIMPAQQDRMAERLRSMITRKSNVNGLWQRPPG
jgi:hypothetical protein